MKTITAFLIICFLLAAINESQAQRHTRGYIKCNGTYVMPYRSSSPNRTKIDNWSSKGNYNPYTGKRGSADPFRIKVRRY